jgi:8-oxo-dGTP pyrophosphatase MutT (NUDIX family)
VAAGFRKGSERPIYKGHSIEVVVGEFFAPDGTRLERDIVHHPGAVCVVPVDGDEAILVRQYRAALDRELLEIPAGVRDVAGEPPEVTAGRLELLTSFFNAPGFSDEELHVYLATDLEQVDRHAHSVEEEHMTIERIRLDAVPGMISSGELDDAKSIIGLLLARQHRSRHA